MASADKVCMLFQTLSITFALFLTLKLEAQDPFGPSFKEKRRSNDVALVLVNEHDGKVVEGFTGFAFNNMLSSHYPRENILLLTKKELAACKKLLRSPTDTFRCSHLDKDCAPQKLPGGMEELAQKLAQKDCPKYQELKRALETGDSIDAYSATHGGEASALVRFTDALAMRPDIQKKFRIFYSMGCEDAAKGDDSYTAKMAMRAGFATFVGHKGFSISPIAFNALKNRLGTGMSIGEAVKKGNEGMKGTLLTEGTQMHLSGDPASSTWKRPRQRIPSKYCLWNRGKFALSELDHKGNGCVGADILSEYYQKYPELIDEKFCASFDPLEYSQVEFTSLAMPVCAALGLPMPQVDKKRTWSYLRKNIRDAVKEELPCADEKSRARALYCFSLWATGKEQAHKEFKGEVPESLRKRMNELSPEECRKKN